MASPDLASLEAELRDFLENAARAPRKAREALAWGKGSDAIVLAGSGSAAESNDVVAAAKAWQARLYDAGLAWVSGAIEFGGRGLSADHERLVERVVAEYEKPNTSCFLVGHHIVAPTILAHGTDDQRRRWLPAIWRGDIICCQLFSEPNAGSDLASLLTAAEPVGDDWVINGQKVWSSGAHYSDIGEILVRTGSPEDRHRGITALIIEMDQPGVSVRPLRQMNGVEHFNEVFFDGAIVPDANRIGEVNGGWRVALSTLGNERSLMSNENAGVVNDPAGRLIGLARHFDALGDAAIRDALVDTWVRFTLLGVTGQRAESEPPAAAPGGPIVKLMMTDNMRRVVETAARILGPAMIADSGAWGTYTWSDLMLSSPGHRIAGGTDEIQKNILAERVLRMPKT